VAAGRQERSTEDVVGTVDGRRLAVHLRLPAWIIAIRQDEEARRNRLTFYHNIIVRVVNDFRHIVVCRLSIYPI